MPENPLLPDAELRNLLTLTRRAAALDAAATRKRSRGRDKSLLGPPASREAILAALTLQLRPHDLLLPPAGDAVSLSLATHGSAESGGNPLWPPSLPGGVSPLWLAAAMAAAFRASAHEQVAVLLLAAGTEQSGWPEALAWAQQRRLPLVVVCTDATGPDAFRTTRRSSTGRMTWSAVARLAGDLQLPILTVDGEDAVAMYRTSQEALLRARAGGGPALLWAALPTSAELAARTRLRRPVARLTSYLRTRGISPA